MATSHKSQNGKASVVDDTIRGRIETLSLQHPDHGARRLLPLLQKEHIHISATTIYNILRQKGLQNRAKRLAKLEERYVLENFTLNENQWRALESHNPCLRERQTQPSHPGRQLYQSTRRVLATDDLGPVYLHATVDAYCLLAFGILSLDPDDIVSDEILETQAVSFFRQHQVPVHTIRNNEDPFLENDGAFQDLSEAESDPGLNDPHPAAEANGYIDYFFRTAEAEFFKNYAPADGGWTLDALQTDFDRWLEYYNQERVHHGFPNMGSAPFALFEQYVDTTLSGGRPMEAIPALPPEKPPAPDRQTANVQPGGDRAVDRKSLLSSYSPQPPEKERHRTPPPETAPVAVIPQSHELRSLKKSSRHRVGKMLVYGTNVVLIVLIIWFGIGGLIKIHGNTVQQQARPHRVYPPPEGADPESAVFAGANSYRQIWQRDLFQTQSGSASDRQFEAYTLSNLPKATDVQLSLIGTVVFNQPERNYAIVYDGTSNNQLMLHEGDRAGSVLFKRILRNKVIIDDGSGEQLLAMEEKPADSSRFKKNAAAGSPPARSVRKVPTSLRRKYLQNRLRRIYRLKQNAAERE